MPMFGELWVGDIYMPGELSQLHRDKSACAWDPSRSYLMYLFIWLFICILYNKLINLSKCFSSSVSSSSKSIEPEEGVMGTCNLPGQKHR